MITKDADLGMISRATLSHRLHHLLSCNEKVSPICCFFCMLHPGCSHDSTLVHAFGWNNFLKFAGGS